MKNKIPHRYGSLQGETLMPSEGDRHHFDWSCSCEQNCNIVTNATVISLQSERRQYHCDWSCRCDWNIYIVAIETVASLRMEESHYRFERSVTIVWGMKKKRTTVATMFIWPNLFNIFNFMIIYLDDILVYHKRREEYLVNFNMCLMP